MSTSNCTSAEPKGFATNTKYSLWIQKKDVEVVEMSKVETVNYPRLKCVDLLKPNRAEVKAPVD